MRNVPNPLKIGDQINDFEHLWSEIMNRGRSVVIKISGTNYRFLNSHYFIRSRVPFLYYDLKAGKIFTYDAKKDIKPKLKKS